jgi:hypothetical protein
MPQVCGKCSHVNPPEAAYCYYDGAVLDGHGGHGGPVQVGAQPFPSQFVFPSGQSCRNFDQFAMACQQNWPMAVDLLRQGFLASFLGGIGRADLALAAQEAARFPDTDRGLDQLLAKLPSQVLQAPKILVEPTEVNLGQLQVGVDRKTELHLANQGMRLLYGSVVSDCKWLVLGDGPGNAQKLFQFGDGAVVPVQIRGKHLRAGSKPMEGHLVVESNGGTVTVRVRAEVPVKPFTEGVLTGAKSPRQIAEKAREAPKQAAALFENGAVERWFKENGWTYPVQGPAASGVGAVQQFFEALGLASAPKVDISERALSLRGDVGQRVQTRLEVKTQEKRPVYAHATCNVPWLDVSKVTLNGRVAIIEVVVPNVPPYPNEVLHGSITVIANGNQRFVVPVSLTITGNVPFLTAPQGVPFYPGVAVPVAPATLAMPGQPIFAEPVVVEPVFAPTPPPLPPTVTPIPILVEPVGAPIPVVAPIPIDPGVAQVFAQAVEPVPAVPSRVTQRPPSAPVIPVPVAAPLIPIAPTTRPAPRNLPAIVHVLPAILLGLVLVGVIFRDIFFARLATDDGIEIDPNPKVAVHFEDGSGVLDEFGRPVNTRSMKFGVILTSAKGTEHQPKKLTYSKYGITNSTVVRIDHVDIPFGLGVGGRWDPQATVSSNKWGGKTTKSTWVFPNNVAVTQIVDIVPGEPVELKENKFKRFLDTCVVRYLIENRDNLHRKVGLRVMIDTLIGEDTRNDGVPFTVPGRSGLVDTVDEFQDPPGPMPDFIQVLEKPDLKSPGIVGRLTLKLGESVEWPSRVLLTHWDPEAATFHRWDVPKVPIRAGREPDSAVVLYWNEQVLAPGKKREVGFSYGLGDISSATGQLGVSVGGVFRPRGDLTVVALVSNPQPGQTLTLKLPSGFKLVAGEATQKVPAPAAGQQQSPVTWRIQAEEAGTFTIEVQSSTGVTQRRPVTIKSQSLF